MSVIVYAIRRKKAVKESDPSTSYDSWSTMKTSKTTMSAISGQSASIRDSKEKSTEADNRKSDQKESQSKQMSVNKVKTSSKLKN